MLRIILLAQRMLERRPAAGRYATNVHTDARWFRDGVTADPELRALTDRDLKDIGLNRAAAMCGWFGSSDPGRKHGRS
jgi:uncharacterized protein YjiS (DUF1127 family)